VYTKLPLGCITILIAFGGVENGEPVTGVSAAVEAFTVNTEIVDDAELATRRNFFPGSVTIESGVEPPVETGEPVVRCMAPEV